MALRFEWDRAKAEANLRKHEVSYSEASTVFEDRLSITKPDRRHSDIEDRYWTIGMSNRGRLVVVAHTEDNETVAIISARTPTPQERKQYEEDK